MSSKVLSIVIPVYNTERYLERCLDSLLIKDVINDIELLIINDGSKDNSKNIIEKYAKKYPKTVVYVDKENGGHGSTINKGLKIATGKYFRVIDSDDWVNSIDFIKLVNRLKHEDADLVLTNYCQERVFDQTSVQYSYENLEDNKRYSFNDLDIRLLKGEYFVMATSTYKLDVLKNANLELLEKTFYVDMQYNIEPVLWVNTICYYDLDIYRYYIGRKDQSVNTAGFVKNQDHHEKVVKYLIDYYDGISKKYSDSKREYVKIILKYMLYTHYMIYYSYDDNKSNAYKKIRKFDKWFKSKNSELYELANDYSIIRLCRKTGFIVVRYKALNKAYIVFSKLIKRQR